MPAIRPIGTTFRLGWDGILVGEDAVGDCRADSEVCILIEEEGEEGRGREHQVDAAAFRDNGSGCGVEEHTGLGEEKKRSRRPREDASILYYAGLEIVRT